MNSSLESDRRPILRPRLLSELGNRFIRRCTVIRAGAGFGKTTLLEQAIEQNHLNGNGIDLYLQCRPNHRFAEALGASLNLLFGASEEMLPSDSIRDWIWRRSPEPVALILDDVHLIPEHSSSAALIEELLLELPMNGHLVLCGRRKAPIPLSRLRARQDVLEFDEDRLAFDSDEIKRFVDKRRVSPQLAEDGMGWPALLELRAAAGGDEVVDFLLDEVLSHLDDEHRATLACVARLETIDDAAIDRLSESNLSAIDLAGSLPLTRQREGGAIAVHSLWKPALSRLPGADDAGTLRATAQLLHDRGELEAALDLLLEINDLEAVRVLVRDLAQTGSRTLGSEALRAILAELPAESRNSADGILLDGLTMLREDPERALPQLTHAAQLFHELGDRDGEIRALVSQGQLAYFRGDVGRLLELGDYGRKLADDGHVAALPLALVAEACGALVNSKPEEALELIDRARAIATVDGVPDFMVAVMASLDAGFPERAVAEAKRAQGLATPEVRGALEINGLGARWQCGHVGPEDLEAIRVWLTTDSNESVHNLAVHLAFLTQLAASLGCDQEAHEFDARAQTYLDRSFDGRAPLSLAIGRAALEISAGDEDAAAAHLQSVVDSGCLRGRPNRQTLRGIVFFYLLIPATRESIDGLKLKGIWSLGREIGQALVALREEGDTNAAAALDWSRSERIAPFVVPSLFTELQVSASAGGAEPPRLLSASTNQRGDLREWLRRITVRGPEPSRQAARNILSQLPITPSAPIEIRVLGPLELRRGGELVDDRDWRRSRVRALLLYLIAHPGCRREALGVALWPDHSQKSIGNNLRVNLHHLMRVLQPERMGNEHLWFLRQEGERLWLVVDEFLRIDANDFDDACNAGWEADNSGVPGLALDHFQTAISLYRGDYCGEADDIAEAAPERTRLRSQFVRAAQRMGELLLAKGETEAVLGIVARILKHDSLFERAYCLQARAFLMAGDRASARQSLESGLGLLCTERLRPSSETESLARELKIVVPDRSSSND